MKKTILVLLILAGCCPSSVSPQHNTNVAEVSLAKHTRRIIIMCVEGHEYYMIEGWAEAGLTLKVDDDGKPVKCEYK